MARINVLKKEVAELIAAGEVVERPASVIKELVENSIDAHATNVTVEIKNGGSTYMRVTDNGIGIVREDVPLAFVSHATSKVLDAQDLEAICTLGFRGEALASICAVSVVEMLTCYQDETIGTRCVVRGGEISEIDDAGCPGGTTIVVRNLFFNVPARMKFLKKDISEGNAVYSVIERIAISHPEISFKLIKDGSTVLQTTGDGKLISAIHSLYGRDFAQSLIEVQYSLNELTVNGYITKPAAARPNRTMQDFFVNGRMVKSPVASKALEEAYKGAIMVGKFPGCVLNIELGPQLVDVNVHPSKTQVRFVNEKNVFEAVYYATKTALKGGDTVKLYKHTSQQLPIREFAENLYKPQKTVQTTIYEYINNPKEAAPKVSTEPFDFFPDNSFQKGESPVTVADTTMEYNAGGATTENKTDFSGNVEIPVVYYNGSNSVQPVCKEQSTEEPEIEVSIAPTEGRKNEAEENAVKEPPSFRVIGEVFKTYILVELEKELLMIDKHAAHERMIYENLKKNVTFEEGQYLIKPVSVTLSTDEYSAAVENISAFGSIGFEVEDFGEGTLLVRQVPTVLRDESIESSVAEIAGYLSKNKHELETRKTDWILHSMACRAAIKSGDNMSDYEMNAFVGELLKREDIRYCPHGRPVCISMPKREIEKNFGRV